MRIFRYKGDNTTKKRENLDISERVDYEELKKEREFIKEYQRKMKNFIKRRMQRRVRF